MPDGQRVLTTEQVVAPAIGKYGFYLRRVSDGTLLSAVPFALAADLDDEIAYPVNPQPFAIAPDGQSVLAVVIDPHTPNGDTQPKLVVLPLPAQVGS